MIEYIKARNVEFNLPIKQALNTNMLYRYFMTGLNYVDIKIHPELIEKLKHYPRIYSQKLEFNTDSVRCFKVNSPLSIANLILYMAIMSENPNLDITTNDIKLILKETDHIHKAILHCITAIYEHYLLFNKLDVINPSLAFPTVDSVAVTGDYSKVLKNEPEIVNIIIDFLYSSRITSASEVPIIKLLLTFPEICLQDIQNKLKEKEK